MSDGIATKELTVAALAARIESVNTRMLERTEELHAAIRMQTRAMETLNDSMARLENLFHGRKNGQTDQPRGMTPREREAFELMEEEARLMMAHGDFLPIKQLDTFLENMQKYLALLDRLREKGQAFPNPRLEDV